MKQVFIVKTNANFGSSTLVDRMISPFFYWFSFSSVENVQSNRELRSIKLRILIRFKGILLIKIYFCKHESDLGARINYSIQQRSSDQSSVITLDIRTLSHIFKFNLLTRINIFTSSHPKIQQ